MVLRGAVNSILLAAVTHTFFHRSNNIDGIAADLLEGSNRPIAALLATTLTTVVLCIGLRRKLRTSYRETLGRRRGAHPRGQSTTGGRINPEVTHEHARPVSHTRLPPTRHRRRELHLHAAGTPDSRSTAEQQRSKRAFSTDQTRPEEHQ